LAQWRVQLLIKHSTSHQLLWCIDSFVLRIENQRSSTRPNAKPENDVPPFSGTSGGGFHSNKYLTHCVSSGKEKFPLLKFGWISKVL
jgi:hypothetical protein